MKWITRERPKIARIASPWLILRFIEPDAVLHAWRDRLQDETHNWPPAG
jgi:hypothetical protein